MPPTRLAAAIAVAVVLVPTAVAAAATTPAVHKEVISTRRIAPLTVEGTGVKKGARLARGEELVFRTVTLEKGQKVRLTLGAPRGMTLRGLVPSPSSAVGFDVVKPVPYVGRSSVTIRAFTFPKATAGKHSGRIWALVG